MTTCSYQTLARYDEMSFCGRARCTNDIRQRHRQDLQNQRFETRLIQRLKIRHLYNSPSQYDDCESNDQYYTQGYDAVDYTSSDHCDPSNWFSGEWSYPCSSNAPSPSLSGESDYSHNSLCDSPAPISSRDKPPRSRHDMLKIRKRLRSSFQDPESVKREFLSLKPLIESNTSRPELISIIVSARWNTIANAINNGDRELVREALALLNDLVSFRLMRITDLLFILQQGLLLSLKDSLSRMGPHPIDVLRFLMSIIRSEPGTTPYITEVMSNTGFFNMFGDLVSMGTYKEAQMVAQFYSAIFQTLCDLSTNSGFNPIVPESIATVNSPQRLAELYNPSSSLRSIVRADLMSPVVNWLFKQIGYIECDTFSSTLNLMASCLNLVSLNLQSKSVDLEWVRSMANTFQQSQPDMCIENSLANGAINNYTDSVKAEIVQFRDFYKQLCKSTSRYLLDCYNNL